MIRDFNYHSVEADYRIEASARECRKAIEAIEALASDNASTKNAMDMLKDVEQGFGAMEAAEASLRNAVRMCEEVTSQVYILAILANVEVGAHSNDNAGFEVIAKSIHPLAEAGAMAAIESKAGLDNVFNPMKNLSATTRNLIKALLSDVDRRKKLESKIYEALRALDRLCEDIKLRG